jgi:hypothetical protein
MRPEINVKTKHATTLAFQRYAPLAQGDLQLLMEMLAQSLASAETSRLNAHLSVVKKTAIELKTGVDTANIMIIRELVRARRALRLFLLAPALLETLEISIGGHQDVNKNWINRGAKT